MQINDETLRYLLNLMDALERATRVHITCQEILERNEIDWQSEYSALEKDEHFQRKLNVLLAPVKENRRNLLALMRAESSDVPIQDKGRVQ